MVGLIALSGCGDDSSDAGKAGKSASGSAASKPAAAPKPTPTPAPTPAKPAVADSRSPEELIAAGRSVYTANCIACHNMDPAQDGALGPAVAGASLSMLESRVLRAEYPEGYTPKRPSMIMVPLPHLESQLPELAAYLNSSS